MDTNSLKCDLCKEEFKDGEEYYLDDLKVCELCFQQAKDEADLERAEQLAEIRAERDLENKPIKEVISNE